MRLAMVAFGVLLLAMAGPARADRVLDGYWWNAQTDEGKLIYVEGVSDGLPLGARFAAGPNAVGGDAYIAAYDHYLAGRPNSALKAQLEAFYADPQNLPIALPDAIMAVLKKAAGDADADAFLAGLRPPPPPPPAAPPPPAPKP